MATKVAIKEDVNWTRIADSTEGFSGADLQALVYNAHLEVVHSSLGDRQGSKTRDLSNGVTDDVQCVFLGAGQELVSKSEKSALNLRVWLLPFPF